MKAMKNLKRGPICASKAEVGSGLLHGPRVLHGEEVLCFGNGSDDDSQPGRLTSVRDCLQACFQSVCGLLASTGIFCFYHDS